MQRATYASAAAVLLAATAATVAAAYLPPIWFRALFALVVVAAVAVVTAAALRLGRRWARPVDAARWVEARIPLSDRLLTLVTASPEARGSRLWPELVQDNRGHLPAWQDAPLDIPAVPRSLGVLLVAMVLATVFVVPWRTAEEPPPAAPGAGPGPVPGAPAPVPGRPPAPGSAVVRGVGDEAAAAAGSPEGAASAALAAIDRLQGQLDERFRNSLGGQAMIARAEEAAGQEATAFRADSPESGIGETESQAGGAPPAEGLARREDGTATGPSVRSLGPSEGRGNAPGGAGGAKAKPADGAGREQAGGGTGAGRRRGGEDGGPKAVADGRSEATGGAGGAGAGSGKATGPLLADAPLTLSGGRESAGFTLTLGAAPGRGGEGDAEMLSAPQGRIAAGERGAQAADLHVRREEIPPEYEGIVKRVFERNR